MNVVWCLLVLHDHPLLCSIDACNEASPSSANNLKDKALILLFLLLFLFEVDQEFGNKLGASVGQQKYSK